LLIRQVGRIKANEPRASYTGWPDSSVISIRPRIESNWLLMLNVRGTRRHRLSTLDDADDALRGVRRSSRAAVSFISSIFLYHSLTGSERPELLMFETRTLVRGPGEDSNSIGFSMNAGHERCYFGLAGLLSR
jgi:hypothetical protein